MFFWGSEEDVGVLLSPAVSICCWFQRDRGNWRILLSSSFRRTSLLLWYSWYVFTSCSFILSSS